MADPSVTLFTRLPPPVPAATGRAVFVPAIDRFPPPLHELMGLLPVCDINGALIAALAAAPAPLPSHVVAGLFAADPFLDTGELTAALRRAGLAAVANYPTVQLLDGATGQGLAAVGYHAGSEFVRLRELAAAGFEALAYVTSPQAAEEALACGLSTLVLHPGPAGGAQSRAGAARIRAIADRAGARMLRHGASAA